MDIFVGCIVSACLVYLVTEINDLQSEVKQLRKDVTWVQVRLDRRNSSTTPPWEDGSNTDGSV